MGLICSRNNFSLKNPDTTKSSNKELQVNANFQASHLEIRISRGIRCCSVHESSRDILIIFNVSCF